MRVGFLQFCPEFGNKEKNLDKAYQALKKVEGDLVVLPELFNTGYLFRSYEELFALAEPIPGHTTNLLLDLARRKDLIIVAGLAEAAGKRIFNSAVLISPQGILGIYRKAHLFFEEKFFFTPGDTPFTVYDVGGAKIGMLICFDYMFPEAARILALKGAQIICHPANLVLPVYGQEVTKARAIENRVFWIMANRCGQDKREDKELNFTGESQIVDPKGRVLFRASADEEILKVLEIDPKLADDKWVTETNELFADRRADLYQWL